jgi:outer membrane receptor protein involved in Fe transport
MFIKRILLIVIAAFSLPILASAQVTTGTITGTVKDANNAGLEGATVKVTNLPTGTVVFTKTRKGGKFDVLNLPAGGPYKIEVTFVGKAIDPREDVFVQLGNEERVDFLVKDANTELTTVTVTGSRGVRTLKSGTSSNFGQRIINNIPNIGRSITNITTLTPQAGGGNSFGGRDGRYNNITIDGANFNNNFGLSNAPLPGGALQPISLDAIDEISVAISPYDAKLGNFTGANISAVTRKGTNQFHGSVYAFRRDEGLLGRKTNGIKVPTVQSSSSVLYGGRIGGPIIKNKLFFFVNGEYEKRDAPGIVWKASRPGVTPDGNTSRVLANDLDSLSNILKTRYNYTTGPYENLGNFLTKGYRILGRLDWNIVQGHTLTLRYNYSKGDDDQLLNGNSAPNPRSSSNRWSNNSMSYENSNYRNSTEVTSYTAELRSNFGNNMSNQLLFTYTTKVDPERSTTSDIFPFVDVQDGAATRDNYISFGYELFSRNNKVDEKNLTINDNFTYNVGKHSISAGGEFQKIKVANSFQRYATSYYRFSNLTDFYNNNAPNAVGFTYPYAGKTAIADLDFGQLAFYLQDEVKVNDRFKLTYGLRVDKPLFLNDLSANPAITALNFRDLNDQQLNIDVSKWPKSRFLINPRIGFNWDVQGNRDLVIRGGAGMFSGRFPFVWFTNMPTNSGVIQNTVELVGAAIPATLRFGAYYNNPDKLLTDFPTQFPSAPGTSSPGSIASVEQNFKMPQVFRASIGADKKLSDNMTISFEAIYNKDINALFQYNANQKAFNGNWNGADKRPAILTAAGAVSTATTDRRFNNAISEAMVLTNTKRGSAFVFTTQLARKFAKNWEASIAYTFTHAMDVTGNPGAQAASAWSNNNGITGQNNLPLTVSEFATPHRFVGFLTWRKEYFKHLGTTIALVYTGFNQGRYNYRYSNDANGDGNSSDLIYVPKDASEIIFVTNSGTFAGTPFSYTAQQQSDAFFAYASQDKYLSKRAGQYVERNGALLPFIHNIDFRLLQDIFTNIGRSRHSLQLSVEVENFGNMINSDWGVSKRTTYSNGAILAFAGLNAAGVPTFRMNAVNGKLPTNSFESLNSVSTTWRANLGLRYSF